MNFSSISSIIARGTRLVALPLLLLTACSKDQPSPTPSALHHPGTLKADEGDNIIVVWPVAAASSTSLTVTQECACPYGTITCTGAPGTSTSADKPQPLTSAIIEQSDGFLYAEGASPNSDPPSDGSCALAKGPDPKTEGPIYYITPNDRGSVLALRYKGNARLPGGHDWFTYQEELGTWIADNDASRYFTWTVLDTPPEHCCEW